MWNFLSSGCIQWSAVTYLISLHQSHTKTPREKCRLFFALPVQRYLKAHPFFGREGFWCNVWCNVRSEYRGDYKTEEEKSISGRYTSYHTPRWLSFTSSCNRTITPPNTCISARPFFPATFNPANTTRCEVRSWMRETKNAGQNFYTYAFHQHSTTDVSARPCPSSC